jgi:hypothetical protein
VECVIDIFWLDDVFMLEAVKYQHGRPVSTRKYDWTLDVDVEVAV